MNNLKNLEDLQKKLNRQSRRSQRDLIGLGGLMLVISIVGRHIDGITDLGKRMYNVIYKKVKQEYDAPIPQIRFNYESFDGDFYDSLTIEEHLIRRNKPDSILWRTKFGIHIDKAKARELEPRLYTKEYDN